MSLQMGLLGLLSYESMSGYDLKQVFASSVNHFWTAQLSQIYRELGALESKGRATARMVPQEGRPDRKVYTITPEGRKAFEQWLEEFPPTLTAALRDEFSLRIFFGSHLPSEELEFQLRRFIKEKEREQEVYRAIDDLIEAYAEKIGRPEERRYWRFTLRKGWYLSASMKQWAEECLIELKGEKGGNNENG